MSLILLVVPLQGTNLFCHRLSAAFTSPNLRPGASPVGLARRDDGRIHPDNEQNVAGYHPVFVLVVCSALATGFDFICNICPEGLRLW
jgi:hypothetical protein